MALHDRWQVHLFSRQLHATVDVGHAILNLERDLGVSADSIVSGTSWLRTAISLAERAAPDATEWKEASMHDLVELDGFVPGHAFVTPQEPAKISCAAIPLAALDPLTPPEGSPPSLGNVLEGLLAAVGCGGCTVPCTDNNPCTVGRCQGNYCHWTHLSDVGCTEDGDNCTKDVCSFGQCTHPPDNGAWCETAGLCTDGSCFGGECQPVPDNLGGPCESDGDECTLDLCDDFGTCTHPPIVCQPDANLCTNEQCEGGDCVSVPVEGSCPPDGNICTDDRCEGGACTYPHNTVACTTDGNVCTDDRCAGGECTHTPNTATCDDDDPCTDNDQCTNGACGGDFCDDQNDCTENFCTPGVGCYHPQVDCDDDNPCTNDACLNGACTHTANSASCNDGNSCTTNDHCQGGACTGTMNTCDDGNPCTDSDCTGGGCHHVANSESCADDGDPCTDDVCANGVCTHPARTGTCDDLDVCTVNDRCQEGVCRGDPRNCADNDPCTVNEHCELDVGCRWGYLCDDSDPCTNDLCSSNGTVCNHHPMDFDDSCGPNACTVAMAGPQRIHVNNDDDDGNGVSDGYQPGPVTGENDAHWVSLAAGGCAPLPGCIYSAQEYLWSVSGPLRASLNANLSGDMSGAWPPPNGFYISGQTPSNACGDSPVLDFHCPLAHDCAVDPLPIQVVGVTQLEWRRFDPTNTPLDDCPNNGGMRIFPDQIDYEDDDIYSRRRVNLVATITPPIPGVRVYFRIFDVDDPFDQVFNCLVNDDPNNLAVPCVRDAHLLDGDVVGGDNRGDELPAFVYSTLTDAFGEAIITFPVSMQPGDNYRAAASVIEGALLQNTIIAGQLLTPEQQADSLSSYLSATTGRYNPTGYFEGYQTPVVWSRMLTVWRRLWIERDTMAPPSIDDTRVIGQFTGITPNVPAPGQATLRIDDSQTTNFNVDENHFEEGAVVLAGCPSGEDTFRIVGSGVVGASKNSYWIVETLGIPGSCAIAGPFILFDDDDHMALGTAANPHFPDGGQLLFDAFADAYVLPVYANQYQDVVDFDMYLTAWQLEYGYGTWDDGRDLTSSSNFWSCLVVGAWEGSRNPLDFPDDMDGDPDTCFDLFPPPVGRPGAEIPLTGLSDGDTGRSAIFFQAIIDDFNCTAETDEIHNVVHEIGHTCGNHPEHVDDTIMEEGAPRRRSRFGGGSLRKFREQDAW